MIYIDLDRASAIIRVLPSQGLWSDAAPYRFSLNHLVIEYMSHLLDICKLFVMKLSAKHKLYYYKIMFICFKILVNKQFVHSNRCECLISLPYLEPQWNTTSGNTSIFCMGPFLQISIAWCRALVLFCQWCQIGCKFYSNNDYIHTNLLFSVHEELILTILSYNRQWYVMASTWPTTC